MSAPLFRPEVGQWVRLKGFTDGCIVPDGWHKVTEVYPKGSASGFCVGGGRTVVWPERVAELRDTSPDGTPSRSTWFPATRKLRERLDMAARKHRMSRSALICHLLSTHPLMEDKPC